jgi:chemotaxis protein MotB
MAISIPDASGVLVRPAQPGGRRGESRAEIRPKPQRGRKLALIVIGAAVVVGVGGAVGAFLSAGGGDAPSGKGIAASALAPIEQEKAKLERELVETKDALAAEKQAADEMRATQAKAAEKEAATTKEKDKLAAVVGVTGDVTQDGEEIKLELVDKVLFRVGEAELTERGKSVLGRVGAALNDVPDKQIWVQGHTDDTPIRPAKGVTPKFPSNWELSSARALTVVHYLQTEAKVDPRRLAAVAFGEYRPASRNKAKNRRIEIVLYPRHQLK